MRKHEATIDIRQSPVKRYIGAGSDISPTTKLNAEAPRARKLQTPMAVAANKVGKKYEFAAKLILKQHVMPNLVKRKHRKNSTELWCCRPQIRMRMPPIVEIVNERIRLNLTPIRS